MFEIVENNNLNISLKLNDFTQSLKALIISSYY